jgi:hypothetical protein
MIRHSQGDYVNNLNLQFKMAIDGRSETDFKALASKEGNQLVFNDPKGQKYRFQLAEEEVHLYRDGFEELDIVFQVAKKSNGTVKLEGLQFVMSVFTRKLSVSDKKLLLEYDLLDGSKTLSSHVLKLAWDKNDGRNKKND